MRRPLRATGHIPLPPYIKRSDDKEDLSRYQTVYAREDKLGSVAAPTAGLHFTEDLRQRLAARGFGWAEVTLYVGYGTFSPIRCEDVRHHRMHREYIEVPESTVESIRTAQAEKRPVIAVGTTSVRALEGAAEVCGGLQPFTGWTDVFLYPGRRFRVVDGMVTNFHLPESSLLLLVSAFAGRERMLAAYTGSRPPGLSFLLLRGTPCSSVPASRGLLTLFAVCLGGREPLRSARRVPLPPKAPHPFPSALLPGKSQRHEHPRPKASGACREHLFIR